MDARLLTLLDGHGEEQVRAVARDLGLRPDFVSSVAELFGRLRTGSYAATIVSLADAHVDAAVIERIGSVGSAGSVLLTSPGSSLDAATLAQRVGAEALLREPIDATELTRSLAAATADEGKTVALPGLDSAGLLGASAPMADVFGMIAQVAPSRSTVLITGESGTGKEVVARALHERSQRSSAPFVAVNCAAIPEHLLESELFGHEKGAFTGAVGQRKGRFERAEGGTLFLDEIGDMSLVLQAKVLRALEERAVERVGGEAELPVDVRVIAATNHALGDAITAGRFREDLYYRLAVVEMELPPLRERGDDVRLLALHFAAHFARAHGREVEGLSELALTRLEGAEWAGNVRELRNVMDRAVLLARGSVIRSDSLRLGAAAPRGGVRSEGAALAGYPTTTSLADVERDHIKRVLDDVGGQIGRAAEVLGVHRNTLTRKIREFGLG
jgi:two-component system response regulator HydG